MSVKILAILLLAEFAIQSEARYGCPTINVLSRCSTWCRCTTSWSNADYSYKTVFLCNGFNGRIGDLDDWLKKNLNGSDIDDFIFNNYRLDRLPASVFERALINRIIISNSPLLKSFGYRFSGKTVFEGLGQSLETLVITNSPSIELDEWEAMVNSLSSGGKTVPVLKNLIFFRQNTPTTIDKISLFNKLANLEKITWRAISLPFLADEPLIDLTPFTKLRLLDLSENRLNMPFNAKLPDSLTTIYLNGNRNFQLFDQDFFTELNSSNVDYINVKEPNNLDCNCENVDEITGTSLGTIFEGTCALPRLVRGKAYGTACVTPENTIKMSNIKKIGGVVQYESFETDDIPL